jgi:hypothetical protein
MSPSMTAMEDGSILSRVLSSSVVLPAPGELMRFTVKILFWSKMRRFSAAQDSLNSRMSLRTWILMGIAGTLPAEPVYRVDFAELRYPD